ncbi:MAG: metallophosphoesterase family protein [Candidatus Woesearchaeota archaeon]
MKFAHLADCHVGSWRDPKLKELSIEAFTKAINICIEKNVDFILIAGDLFNNALPSIDNLKVVVKEFKRLKECDISVYMIPGSHDYSPSGKTMIDVLEEAGLVKNVFKGVAKDNKLFLKFTVDEKTGVKLTGILGRRGTLERNYYEALDVDSLERESGEKIFLFHSAVAEMMPKEFALIESTPISMLPKNFEYYAGGHIHIVKHESFKGHKNVVYPGPLFPASFSELEKLGNGGFYIYDNGKVHREELNLKNTYVIDIDANHKSPEEVYDVVMNKVSKKEFLNTIILMRFSGTLKTGKVSDVKFNEIFEKIYSQGAFYVLKNTSKLQSEEFEEIKIDHENIETVEDAIIKEHLQQFNLFPKEKEYDTIKDLMKSLSSEKHEGEKVHEYEDRIRKDTNKVLDI